MKYIKRNLNFIYSKTYSIFIKDSIILLNNLDSYLFVSI